jgi:hypothetical protein
MPATRAMPSVISLAAVDTGDHVLIHAILFDALRVECESLGIGIGDTVQCATAAPASLLIETSHGRTVSLKRDWARFIQVSPAAL